VKEEEGEEGADKEEEEEAPPAFHSRKPRFQLWFTLEANTRQ